MPATHSDSLRDRFVVTANSWHVKLNEELSDTEKKSQEGLSPTCLAIAEGPMAFYPGVSENGRYYSTELWDKTLERITPRMEKGGLFGAIGHEQALDEAAIANGDISHRTMALWPDEKNGVIMGRIRILNTDSGRNLNTCMREGMPIAVSSRAYGKVAEGQRGPENSIVIDPETYFLETFDFVVNPGVEAAYPRIIESKEHAPKGEAEMPNDTNESLKELKPLFENFINEKSQLTLQLNEALAENKKLKEQNQQNMRSLVAIQKTVGPKPVARLKAIHEGLMKWMMLEPFKSVGKEYDILSSGQTTMDATLNQFFKVTESYRKHGTPAEIAQKLDTLKKFESVLGTPEKAQKAVKLLEAYVDFGFKPEALGKVIETAKKAKSIYDESRKKVAVKKLAEHHNVNEALVENLLKGMSVEEVSKALKSMNESADLDNRYRSTQPEKKAQESKTVPFKKVAGTSRVKQALAAFNENVNVK